MRRHIFSSFFISANVIILAGLMQNNTLGTKSALDSGKDHKFLQHWVYKFENIPK